MDKALYEQLKNIAVSEVNNLMVESRPTNEGVLGQDWWHQKFYQRQTEKYENNGFTEKNFRVENDIKREIPYARDLFYPTNGRFSLSGHPIAYFSDWLTGTCEKLPFFREKLELSSADLEQYMKANFDPDLDGNKLCGYPRVYCLNYNVKILDASGPSVPLFRLLTDLKIVTDVFYSEMVLSRDKYVYSVTQAIASFANENGFHGILYRSVRIPRDWYYVGGDNLVLFADKIGSLPIIDKATKRLFKG